MPALLKGVWDAIADVKTVISLTAFAMAVVLVVTVAYLRSKRRKIPNAFWVVILALVLMGVAATLIKPGEVDRRGDVYRVRVTVLSPEQTPVEDAKVWSSFGGEPKKVAGGWQFDIPAASKPQDSRVIFYATRENAFLTGKQEARLDNDFNPAVTISLRHDDSARVRGQVVDRSNRGIVGARVFVVGHEAEAVVTKEGGNFDLPSHAAVDQQVSIHAEKAGYRGVSQWHPAGDTPAILTLER
ncbi:MAG TPA: hypothetical protein VJ464_04735 [Blastocatellia bacterium]|nr:hypothetical protein [Blastocatellia bacterium]